MENNEINKSNNDTPVSAEKKHKTHFAISLAIIAAALVIAAIVAIVAVVGNIVSSDGLSLDGTKLNGQTASELYEGIESGLANSANYTISLTKHGIAAANLMIEDTSESLSIDITSHIESRVDGNNFYYKKTTTTRYKSAITDQMTTDESVIELTVFDGVVYFVEAGQKLKVPVNSEEYKNSLDAISEMIWEKGSGIFADEKITKTNGGYVVSATNFDKKLLESDARKFFNGTKGDVIWALAPSYTGDSCTVVYDEDGRPISANYSYTLSNNASFLASLTGSVAMTSTVKYDSTSVTKPADANEYIEVSAEQLPK